MNERPRPLSPFMQLPLAVHQHAVDPAPDHRRAAGARRSCCSSTGSSRAASGPDAYATRAVPVSARRRCRSCSLACCRSFCYHLLNGIRHLCLDFGLGFELPAPRARAAGGRRRLRGADGAAVGVCCVAALEARHEPAQPARSRARPRLGEGGLGPLVSRSASRPSRLRCWVCGSSSRLAVVGRHRSRARRALAGAHRWPRRLLRALRDRHAPARDGSDCRW